MALCARQPSQKNTRAFLGLMASLKIRNSIHLQGLRKHGDRFCLIDIEIFLFPVKLQLPAGHEQLIIGASLMAGFHVPTHFPMFFLCKLHVIPLYEQCSDSGSNHIFL